MPQPIRFSHQIIFDFHPKAVLQRPLLAAHIAAISSIWNEIEASTASLLTALLGGEMETGISMFFAVKNDGSKRAMADAISKLKLTPSDQRKLQEIQNLLFKNYKTRNNAIHGSWGISPEFPDQLLWMDARGAILMHVNLLKHPGDGNKAKRATIMLEQQKHIQVWSERDFLDAEDKLMSALEELLGFAAPFINHTYAPIAVNPPKSAKTLLYPKGHPD